MKKIHLFALCFFGAIIAHGTAETPSAQADSTASVPVSDRAISDWIAGRVPGKLLRVMPGETPVHLRYAQEYIDQYEVIGSSPVTIPADAQDVLKSVLDNEAGFGPLRPDRCKFRPGLSFRIGTGSDQLDLLVCFACDEIAVVPAGKSVQAIYAFDQPTRDILLNLSKSLLPSDEAIQELPAVRRDKAAPPPPAPPLPDTTGDQGP